MCGSKENGQRRAGEGLSDHECVPPGATIQVTTAEEWSNYADLDLHLLDASGNTLTSSTTAFDSAESVSWVNSSSNEVPVVIWTEFFGWIIGLGDLDYSMDVSIQ